MEETNTQTEEPLAEDAIILQEEKVEVTEKIIDQETGQISDETKIEITPAVEAPEPNQLTLGDLKLQLSTAIANKDKFNIELDQERIDQNKIFDDLITTLQSRIAQVK